METLGSLRRTNYCGEVSLAMAGQEMTVCGSIARARDKGGIIFADLRDTTGILQLVFDEDTPKEVFARPRASRANMLSSAAASCASAPPRPTRSPPAMWSCMLLNCAS